MGWYSYDDWRPHVSVAERRRQAAKKIARMKKAGLEIAPVEISGRKIATTFWGDAWCKNLEAYSDYANRLPRGRTYVRNGSVIDLKIEAGSLRSLVSGSEIYDVDIRIKPLAKPRWTDIKGRCAGQIDSMVELLRGSISKGVMEIVTRKGEGLFPSPKEISLSCSCPDWATMCKHVAATLYGVGTRLDHEPETLFILRGVNPAEMVEAAFSRAPTARKSRRGRTLASDELSSIFGVDIDMAGTLDEDVTPPVKRRRGAARNKKKTGKRSKTVRKTASRTQVAKKKAPEKKTAAAKKKTVKKPAVKKAAASAARQSKTTSRSTGRKNARR